MSDNRQKKHNRPVGVVREGYSDYVKYHKPSVSQTKTQPLKKSVSKKVCTKKKVNTKHKKVRKGNKVAIFLLATTLGITFFISNRDNLYFNLGFIGEDSRVEENDSLDKYPQPPHDKERLYDRDDFINYKEHCIEGSYGSERYLFLTDEYLYEMAEYAIRSLDEAFLKAGKKVIANGSSLPEFLTEEFLMGVTMSESSKRVCSLGGTPLGLPDNMDISNYGGALGLMQQKDGFRDDGDRYIHNLLGDDAYKEFTDGIDLNSVDPLISMYRAIANYTRYYDNYLYRGSPAESLIGKDKIITGAIACYNKGEGTFSSWISKDSIGQFWHYAEESGYVNNISKYMIKYEKWAKDVGYKNTNTKTLHLDEDFVQ